MKFLQLIFVGFTLIYTGICSADTDYSAGSSFGKQVKGSGTDVMKNFDPSTAVEGYTRDPKEKDYWPGTTGSSTSINEIGGKELVNSEMGKAVTDSMINNPTESISMDAPFLQTGLNAKENAEAIVGGTGDFCEKSIMSNISFDRFTCNKDVNIEEICTRTSQITGTWKNQIVTKTITVTAFTYWQNGSSIQFSYVAPVTGTISSATFSITSPVSMLIGTLNFMNTTATWGGAQGERPVTINLNASGMQLTAGQVVNGDIKYTIQGLAGTYLDWFKSGKAKQTLVLTMKVTERVWDPKIEWSESCPFNKSGGEGTLSTSVCTEAGGNKTVYAEGKPYTIYSSCWAYKDTYITQTGTEGSCGEYIKNPACTVVSRQCDSYSEDSGYCVNEAVTYECEKVTQAEGMLCGDDFFCTDGSCEATKQGQDSGFKHAVSQLAAVSAAGDDVAELNEGNITAFTGKGQKCRKTAVGFSNCCKDSGWGHDLGLDSCNSEEKALGQAKSRKLTVEIGEYCSTKVLGVCLEKKRSYCVFESKLAQIVQHQGRKWQLGIGFGSAKSPNCRGITIEELQSIDFDKLDFSNFYSDLDDGLEFPDDSELMNRVQEQIKEQLSNQGAQ